MSRLLLEFAAGFAIALAAWAVGERALKLGARSDCGNSAPHSVTRWALATAAGLAILSTLLFVLGLIGLLGRGFVVLAFLGVVISGLDSWRALWQEVKCRGVSGRFQLFLGFGIGLAVLPFLVLALYPETGFDATLYHLPFAKGFLESGRLGFFSTLRFPVFPQAAELLFSLALALGAEGTAALTQTLGMILVASLLVSWGTSCGSRAAGLLAASLWLGTPLVVSLGTMAYVDIGLTLFATASLYCFCEWRRLDEGRWLGWAGSFAGFAAATKYLGLYFVAAVAVLAWTSSPSGRRWKRLFVAGGCAGVVLAPWYARIFFHTGNPVFPFFARFFGESAWSSSAHYGPPRPPIEGIPDLLDRCVSGLLFLVRVPWSSLFEREIFHFQAPSSPFYLLLLPLCGLLVFRFGTSRTLFCVSTLYAFLWLGTNRDLRFLVPILPTLNLALMLGLVRARTEWWDQRKVIAASLVLMAPGFLYSIREIVERGRLPLDEPTRIEFLEGRLPGVAALLWMNSREGSDYTVYSFGFENLRYFSEGRFLGDHFGPWSFSKTIRRLEREPIETIDACFVLVPANLRHSLGSIEVLPSVFASPDFTVFEVPGVPCRAGSAEESRARTRLYPTADRN